MFPPCVEALRTLGGTCGIGNGHDAAESVLMVIPLFGGRGGSDKRGINACAVGVNGGCLIPAAGIFGVNPGAVIQVVGGGGSNCFFDAPPKGIVQIALSGETGFIGVGQAIKGVVVEIEGGAAGTGGSAAADRAAFAFLRQVAVEVIDEGGA